MQINVNQIIFLFFSKFREYGMKSSKTTGMVVVDLSHTMNHTCYVTHTMNDNQLSCMLQISINHIDQTIALTFSPKNKFDIFNLILPCNQDPAIIQKTYNLLYQELSKPTFNCTYSLTYEQLANLHTEYFDGNNEKVQAST